MSAWRRNGQGWARLLIASLLLPILLQGGSLGQAAPMPAPGPQRAEQPASLAGRFLVATPQLVDPNFTQTVVYMVEHNERGAMGLVINRPLGQAPIERLLEKLNGVGAASDEEIRIYAGGPVETGRGFVLHSTDVLLDGSRVPAGDIAVTTSPEMLHALAEGKGPVDAIFLFGHAGWGPGQLEGEITRGAWDTIEPDAALVFDEPDDSRWKQATSRHGVEL